MRYKLSPRWSPLKRGTLSLISVHKFNKRYLHFICSRFPIPDSRFPIPDSRFPIPYLIPLIITFKSIATSP
ncbi:MAG: hypothetical protein F6K51_08955 [Moorea sp. SIO3I8]|nr:hypothetical protein [Moorena sp. SIO3I8]